MSKSFKVWIDYASFGKVMKSKGMREVVYQSARNIATRAGKGYSASSYIGKSRASARVWDNSGNVNNELLKAVR